jgi:hypothetical protein
MDASKLVESFFHVVAHLVAFIVAEAELADDRLL